MLNIPAPPSPGTSFVEIMAIIILVSGVVLALLALPSFRENIIDRYRETKDYILDNKNEEKLEEENSVVESVKRREILDFDLSIFEEKK